MSAWHPIIVIDGEADRKGSRITARVALAAVNAAVEDTSRGKTPHARIRSILGYYGNGITWDFGTMRFQLSKQPGDQDHGK